MNISLRNNNHNKYEIIKINCKNKITEWILVSSILNTVNDKC